jgi:hypothetical protein
VQKPRRTASQRSIFPYRIDRVGVAAPQRGGTDLESVRLPRRSPLRLEISSLAVRCVRLVSDSLELITGQPLPERPRLVRA